MCAVHLLFSYTQQHCVLQALTPEVMVGLEFMMEFDAGDLVGKVRYTP